MKTPQVKKREVSLHSRAARRGASPVSKDLAVKVPAEEKDYKPWLHGAQNAGISKKKKVKQLTRQQKVRQQRALEKADVNVDKLERKIQDSKARGKKIQVRAKDWDELNGVPEVKQKEAVKGDAAAADAKAVAEGSREEQKMEDVKLPDLEQPLPIRVAESGDEALTDNDNEQKVAEEVDEVT